MKLSISETLHRAVRWYKHKRFKPYLAPFTEKMSLRPLPQGDEARGPDYVGVGFGKAGTTWWHNLIVDHPNVVLNRLERKELHYFEHYQLQAPTDEDIENYRNAFAAPRGFVCGESSGYIEYPLSLRFLAEAAPDTRILVMVRNPIDFLRSLRNHRITEMKQFLNLNKVEEQYFRAHYLHPRVFDICNSYQTLEMLLELFPRENILALQFEKCVQDPASEIARTYRFLGLDDAHVPSGLETKVNPSKYKIESFSTEERRYLSELFREKVERTLSLFPGIDRSLWPDFL